MAIHATSESMWRLDRLTGPTEALEAFDEVIEQATRCNGVLGMCGAPVVECGPRGVVTDSVHVAS
ncbi:hypothetical protein C9J85_10275 [Haloferax sp. wsp5]|nr:hypothetical protein C9J85_10275 [Haloferax sp. wsp5]